MASNIYPENWYCYYPVFLYYRWDTASKIVAIDAEALDYFGFQFPFPERLPVLEHIIRSMLQTRLTRNLFLIKTLRSPSFPGSL